MLRETRVVYGCVHEVIIIINRNNRIGNHWNEIRICDLLGLFLRLQFINRSYECIGFQQGDTWVLEKVLVDVLTSEADKKLRKEEEEIEAGTYKREDNEDKNEEDPRAYFTSETITLYDLKPESKVVDLDADQIEVLEKETKQKIEQLKKDDEFKV